MRSNLREWINHRIAIGINGAAYRFKSPKDNRPLSVVISTGMGWDHVSVSRTDRCPSWHEMEWIIKKFAKEDEYWYQLHVPEAEHVNFHTYTLHWWRPQHEKIPLPDAIMV